ncbi:MAG: SAM-dependent methyltransferase [Candidatus Methanohalarchaeum thermophilum]|uniref:SAM-dependent methyltransferase n=1 Tax=Methanohalarchaeum thermophilum TaxID=1903181 RepID=A0A1Q6DSU6_METT1|nr:MAG: SAM-dependent methyltransferase [Candidatus Methanohalarchaeum thermophilum]
MSDLGSRDRSKVTTPNWFKDIIKDSLNRNSSVLEVGCGTGALSGEFNRDGHSVVGCDLKLNRLKKAHQLKRGKNFIRCDAENLPFNSNTFDAVVSIEVIEHLKEPKNLIKQVNRVLKDDGYFFLKTPNKFTHDIFQAYKFNYFESKKFHPNVLTHHALKNILKDYKFKFSFLKSSRLPNYQKEKLGPIIQYITKLIPFNKLPLIFQPSIYVIGEKRKS